MNIFILDDDPGLAAQYHCDKHVVKMILETVQILMTTLHHYEFEHIPYKPTHVNHPCVVWARQSFANFHWLNELGAALVEEWRYRWNHARNHKAWESWMFCKCINAARGITWPQEGFTPAAQAMPEWCKDESTVQAYRNYYLYEKTHLLTYTRRDLPPWMEEDI